MKVEFSENKLLSCQSAYSTNAVYINKETIEDWVKRKNVFFFFFFTIYIINSCMKKKQLKLLEYNAYLLKNCSIKLSYLEN